MRQPIPREQSSISSNSLSSLLDQVENLQGKVGGGSKQVATDLILLLERCQERFHLLEDQNAHILAEKAQLEHIETVYRKQAGGLLKDLGGAGTLEELRAGRNPLEEDWWWWPERIESQKRKTALNRLLRGLAIAAGVLLVLTILYQAFLKPDPSVVAAFDAQQHAEDFATKGDFQAGLNEVDKGLQAAPNNPELLVLKGCILTQIKGKESDAAQVFALAETKLGDRELFLLTRSQTYSILGFADSGIADAQAAIALNPKSAKGYMLLGQGLEAKNDLSGAYNAYDRSSQLGNENNDPTTAAQARIKMGMMMQSMNILSTPSETITPTP